jgi:hypothetical protein
VDVLETAQDVDFLVCKNDSCPRGVLDGEFGLSVFACDAADGTGEVVAAEGFDVFDFEGFDVEIVLWFVSD